MSTKPEDFNDKGFWDHARNYAGKLPFAKEMMAMYYCMMDGNTPTWVKAAIASALAYFALPVDAIPDVVPLLGFSDDASMIAAAFALVKSHVTPEHHAKAEQAFQ